MDIFINKIQYNKHFFHQKIDSNETDDENKENLVSKIYLYNFFSLNEIGICKKIQKIPYYENYYIILQDYNFINIGDLSEQKIETTNNYSKNKYLLFQYKNNKCIKFNDFFLQLKTPKILILNLLDSFYYLLNSLNKLNKNIVYFNLSSENIVFNYDCGQKPFLIDFKKSLNISKLNENYMIQIIEKTYNYTHKPLEVQLLFYLIHNDLNTISVSLIEQICEAYVDKLSILQYFSQNYKDRFNLLCRNFLNQYVNKSKKVIIENIISYNNTWDCYSLSILYLHIFCGVIKIFDLQETLFNKVVLLLAKNINPNPLHREDLNTTLKLFEDLYNKFLDWSFVNKISNEKIIDLYNLLFE